ncbi:MAG: hypothetical protein LUC30_02520 [Clostridiales bacterium]|nr:hypothetical protein [Clostridiales bacterium]
MVRRSTAILLSALFLILGLAGGFAVSRAISPRGAAILQTALASEQEQGDVASLVSCAVETAQAIRSGDYETLAEYVHPEKGVTFTPNTTVDAVSNLNFLPDALVEASESTATWLWGTTTDAATPINLTLADYFASYVWERDYLASPRISVDSSQVAGNGLENVQEAYPDGRYVEFYATDGESNWSTLKLVYEWENGAWYLVGVVHSAWVE